MRVTPEGRSPKKGVPREVPRSPPLKHTTGDIPFMLPDTKVICVQSQGEVIGVCVTCKFVI